MYLTSSSEIIWLIDKVKIKTNNKEMPLFAHSLSISYYARRSNYRVNQGEGTIFWKGSVGGNEPYNHGTD
jgi:hypothetical protein